MAKIYLCWSLNGFPGRENRKRQESVPDTAFYGVHVGLDMKGLETTQWGIRDYILSPIRKSKGKFSACLDQKKILELKATYRELLIRTCRS